MKKFSKIFVSSLLLASLGVSAGCNLGGNKDDIPDDVVADKYKVVVACQTEMGEEEVLKVLEKAYEAKHTDVDIEIKTFSGESYEQYMLGIAAEQSSSPNIIWTADTYHSHWNEYYVDLRPYYEASPETDYSNYYETMLDTAGINGKFKPTKNYTGSFDREKDNSDGKEHYSEHSEYGLFYAPRDYNKPAILCNTHLFAEFDAAYELVYKTVNGVSAMPADYKSTSARLQEIVAGTDWDDFYDLPAFARFIAERMLYVVQNGEATGDRQMSRKWSQRAVLNLFLEWEPTYTTVMDALGVDVINADGTLNLKANEEKLQALHDALSPSATEDEKEMASLMTTPNGGIQFSSGNLFMSVVSRPVVLGYGNTFKGMYGEGTHMEAIRFPVENIAAGCSGYAISSIWEGKTMTVNGVSKSYTDLSWDFIKFIITEEGQEAAGETGLNIPVLKKLYNTESNGGKEPAWRKVASLGSMDNDAWVAGNELSQDTYNIFKADKRNAFRNVVRTFYTNLIKTNYNDGDLATLITKTEQSYSLQKPTSNLR